MSTIIWFCKLDVTSWHVYDYKSERDAHCKLYNAQVFLCELSQIVCTKPVDIGEFRHMIQADDTSIDLKTQENKRSVEIVEIQKKRNLKVLILDVNYILQINNRLLLRFI